MPENKLYEYAVIRLVPKVEREEFFNIGLILFSKKANYIRVEYVVDKEKLSVLKHELDFQEIDNNLEAFKQVAKGEKSSGPFSKMEIAERFRWLTAVKSAVIQTSCPHPGMTNDLDATFTRLFDELVK
ncbi:MAG: DUF3037 domain-containing protein [Chitinophagaceae bacterium]|nr:DUF3037 domain-containing protein [Bacteroidota bacterium]MCC6257455.1 DUF3037 domain-containing protein [Chitinophagaceae bacterium]MCW5916512.1 DUF3037 domain-containing protein [Ferruginibacter sp.]